MKKLVVNYAPGLLLLAIALVIGLVTYKDYGVGWDEPIQREMGLVSYRYVVDNDQALKTFNDADHGVAFELVLLFIEKGLGLTDTREIFFSRHLSTHLFFLLGAFVAYVLFYNLFKSRLLACIGFIILVAHPRIYAHSFYNSKDIPFLCMFIISFTLAYAAYKKDKAIWFFLLGLSVGFTTGIRVMGIMLIGIFALFFLIDLIRAVRLRQNAPKAIKHFAWFIFGALLMLYASWPLLWEAPIANFTKSFKSFAHISWNAEVLFAGEIYTGTTLPASYVPVWICITTPILWLLLSSLGIVILLYYLIKTSAAYITNNANRNFVLYLLCIIAPVGAVIVLHSVIYDDWRHLYFIYPSFVLLALYGLDRIWSNTVRKIVVSAGLLQLAYVVFFMVKYHPSQQVYFNELVSCKKGELKKKFEMDYWGCSYRQGLEYILEHDKSDSIRVFWSLHPVINNVMMLTPAQRARIVLVSRGEFPYYFITNYRGRHPKDRFDHPMVYSVEVLNSAILGVYKVTSY